MIGSCNERGLETFIWTMDDPGVAREMGELGAHYLVTNRPGWMRDQLG